jgi:hypothetical protein
MPHSGQGTSPKQQMMYNPYSGGSSPSSSSGAMRMLPGSANNQMRKNNLSGRKFYEKLPANS